MATLREIKTQANVENLELNFQKDAQGNRVIDAETNKPTEWMRAWNNNDRVAISVHTDVVAKIKANPAIATLALKDKGMVVAKDSEKPYQLFVLIDYKPADETL